MKTKTRKQSNSTETTITIGKKDRNFLQALKKEMRLASISALIEKINKMIKELKLQKELK